MGINIEWMPMEQVLHKETSDHNVIIGLPTEQDRNESRIALTPSAINILVKQGYKVVVERNLGSRTCFSNNEFAEAGAIITSSHSEAFFSDIVIRVSPPDLGEIELMKSNAVLLSSISGILKNEKCLRALLKNKITAISFEHIQTANAVFPLRNIIQEIGGNTAIIVATSLLADSLDGQGRSLSGFPGIPPAEVLILGSNTAARSAASTALGIGAFVKVLGQDIMELRDLVKVLKFPIYTDVLNEKSLQDNLCHADIVICTLQPIDIVPDFFVSSDFISKMKKNSIIIDLSIDCGGTFNTSHPTTHINPVYKEYNVVHYCVPNITALIPNTTSVALSNFLLPALQRIKPEGGVDNFLQSDTSWLNGVYTYKGHLTNLNVSRLHNLPYKEIDLLMAIFNK